MNNNTHDRQRGLVLVEIMMVAGIMIIVSTLIFQFFAQGVDAWELSSYQGDLHTHAALAMEEMVKELRVATRTAVATPPKISIPAAPGNTQIWFYLPRDLDANGLIIDAAGNVEWDNNNVIQYQFVPASRQLQRVAGANLRVLANDVTAVTFNDQTSDATLLANEVKISLTLQKTTPHRRVITVSSTSVVKLRN